MTCPSCGSDLDLSQLACPRCGHLSGAASAEAVPQPHEVAAGPGPRSPWADPASGSYVSGDVDPTSHTVPLPHVDEPARPLSTAEEPGAAAEPTLAFASPGHYAETMAGVQEPQPAPWAATTPPPAWDAAATPAPTAPRRRLLVPILLLAFALVVVGGGVATAGYFLGWFGGGKRPSELVPGSAVSYVQVDLNPSLVQKASAWQFLHDLPQVKQALAAGQPDPKAVGWKLLSSLDGNPLKGVDYERDVKPWLGDRFGIAVMPGKGEPAGEFVVQVKDEARAAATLRDWAAKAEEKLDVTIKDGYALLTRPGDTAAVMAGLDAGSLADNPDFAKDFGSLGDPGVLAGWADIAGLAKLDPAGTTTAARASGRGVFSLTFAADTMTVGGALFGLGGAGIQGTTDLGNLPASTWMAAGFSGVGEALSRDWDDLPSSVGSWLELTGLAKDDLIALFGRSLSVGVASVGTEPDLTRMPDFGARIVTDDTDRAQAALESMLELSGGPLIISTVAPDGALIVAGSDAYRAELAEPSARLSSLEQFTKAVPDHARATASSYLYLKPLVADVSWADEEYADFLKGLRSFGAEYVASGPDSGTWSVRLVRG